MKSRDTWRGAADAGGGQGAAYGYAPGGSALAVRDAVQGMLAGCCNGKDFAPAAQAFEDVVDLYQGRWPGYGHCHTPYHDLHHGLDVTLTLGRLIDGQRRDPAAGRPLPAELVALGLVCALFHDAGYLRKRADRRQPHGAAYTSVHVRRSGRFLAEYLERRRCARWTPMARSIVAFTSHGPRRRCHGGGALNLVGCMLASADLLSQLADPWYLEKCLFRLHPEFVIAGMLPADDDLRGSARALLQATPAFMRASRAALDDHLGGVHRFVEHACGGNPYLAAYERNLARLERLLADDDLDALRPPPDWPCA